jgi:hypothetical protein
MATTPYLKLQKPPFDTIPWDEAINGNMDTLDAYISRFIPIPNYVGGWGNSVSYIAGQNVLDASNSQIYQCQVSHTSSASPVTFTQDRATYPTYWVQTTNVVTVQSTGDVGRNLIHNAMFNIYQRGVGPFTTGGYNLDQWEAIANTDTFSVTRTVLTDSDRTGIGDEQASGCLGIAFAGTSGAGAYTIVLQQIENVRRLAGKTVTVSFWAATSEPTGHKLGVNPNQFFGTGGSPSGSVGIPGQSVTLSQLWTRYSLVFTLPSVNGKTLGSNGDSTTLLYFWCSAGSASAAQSGNVGVQTGNIFLWGVQLEIGSVMSPLEKLDIADDLAKCQRYFQVGSGALSTYTGAQVANYLFTVPLQVTMRAAPSAVITPSGGGSFSSVTGYTTSPWSISMQAVSTTASQTMGFNYTFTASAEI